MYYYNAIEGEEELHEEEALAKLEKGNTIERNGEYWLIVDVLATTGIGTPKPFDSIRVFLSGPLSQEQTEDR